MKIIYYIKKWMNIRTHEKTLYSRVEARDPKALASRCEIRQLSEVSGSKKGRMELISFLLSRLLLSNSNFPSNLYIKVG